jgi:RNA polymerase sigma factor (sigma-70 family)
MASASPSPLLRSAIRALAEAPGATDRELLDRFARSRDELAFEALVRRYSSLVLGVGRRVLGKDDADDVFQATFLLLARKAGTVAWQDCVAGWLHRTALQLAYKARDSAQRRTRHERLAPARESASPLDQITARELLGVLDEELLGLPDRYRAPLVLCYLQGATRDDAARELGCPVATVKTRLERGRDRLHRALQRRGLTLTAALTAAAVLSGPAAAGAPARAVVRAACALAAGQPLAEVVSTRVTRLLDGGLRAMFLSKMRAALTLLAVCGVFSGVTVWVCGAGADKPGPKVTPSKPAAAPRAEGKVEEGKLNCAGRVLSPEGKPVGKAKVVFLRHGNDEGGGYAPVAAASAHTEANGNFRFVVPPAPEGNGPLHRWGRLLAVAPGYAPGWVKIDKPEDARGATVRLVKDDVPLEGRVVDLEGRPVAGATVRVMQLQAREGEDLGPWVKELAAKKSFDRTGYPNVRIDVEALGLDRAVRTDAQGRFRITGLGRERLAVLRFSGPTIEACDVYAMTRAGTTLGGIPRVVGGGLRAIGQDEVHPSSFTHVAAPSRPVTGTVTDKETGKPVAGAVVHAWMANSHVRAKLRIETTTDAKGRYRLVGLPRVAGRRVTVAPAVATGYLPAGKDTPGGPDLEAARLDFALARGVVIRGRVTDKATGQPVRAWVKYFTFADNPHLKASGAFRNAIATSPLTGPDGTFTLLGLPGRGFVTATVPRVGDYSTKRTHYLYGVGAEEVARLGNLTRAGVVPYFGNVEWTNTLAALDLAPGKREATCDLALDPGTTLKGRIVDPQGKPVTGARIDRMFGPSDVKAVVGPAGQFTLSCVDPKRTRTYFFRHEKRKLGAVAMLKGDKVEGVTVTLQPYGALTGRLVDADGAPLAGYQVHGRLDGNQLGFRLGWLGFFHATADKAGRFRAEFLAGVRVSGPVTTEKGRRTDRWLEKITLQPGKVHDLGDVKVGPAMRED